MKNMLNRFDFTNFSFICLLARIVAAGASHAPMLTGFLVGSYAAAWIGKLLTGLIAKFRMNHMKTEKGIKL